MDGCTITGLAFIVIQATVSCPQSAVPVARFCELAKIVRYSRQDTADTRRQLRYHNAVVRSACGASK